MQKISKLIHKVPIELTECELQQINPNPQAGELPLSNIYYNGGKSDQIETTTFEAYVNKNFIERHLIPRGRPHLSLIHLAYINDAIAAVSFSTLFNEAYGLKKRYIELSTSIKFFKEAFYHECLEKIDKMTFEVEEFIIRWGFKRCSKKRRIEHHGLLNVCVFGLKHKRETLIAQACVVFYQRRAVINNRSNS